VRSPKRALDAPIGVVVWIEIVVGRSDDRHTAPVAMFGEIPVRHRSGTVSQILLL
jgi:hypothetical protein